MRGDLLKDYGMLGRSVQDQDCVLVPRVRAEEIISAAMESLLASHPLSDAWKAELDRREAEYEQGKVELIDNDEVFAQVRARLQRSAS